MSRLLFLIISFVAIIEISFASPSDTINHCVLLKVRNKYKLEDEKAFETVKSVADSVCLQNMTVKEFKMILGVLESGNNYYQVNKFGFKGKYAFSDYLIEKITRLTPKAFLNSPLEQEEAMNKAIYYYLRFIKRENFLKYINKEVGGAKITLEALLAGCHFSPTYLEFFLKSNGNKNSLQGGVTIGVYMASFRNYNLRSD